MPLPETARSFIPDYVHDIAPAQPEPMYVPTGFYTSDVRQSGIDIDYHNPAPYHKPTSSYVHELSSIPVGSAYGGYPESATGLGLDLGGQYSIEDVGIEDFHFV
jgi:hypothetical protein